MNNEEGKGRNSDDSAIENNTECGCYANRESTRSCTPNIDRQILQELNNLSGTTCLSCERIFWQNDHRDLINYAQFIHLVKKYFDEHPDEALEV